MPRALVLLDGRTKTTTLFVAPRNERLERSEGPVLVPGDEAARLTGIAQVRERDAFAEALKAAATPGRTLYIPHRAESLGAATPPQVLELVDTMALASPERAIKEITSRLAAVPDATFRAALRSVLARASRRERAGAALQAVLAEPSFSALPSGAQVDLLRASAPRLGTVR